MFFYIQTRLAFLVVCSAFVVCVGSCSEDLLVTAVGSVTSLTNMSHNAMSHMLGGENVIGPGATDGMGSVTSTLGCGPGHTTLVLDTRGGGVGLNIVLFNAAGPFFSSMGGKVSGGGSSLSYCGYSISIGSVPVNISCRLSTVSCFMGSKIGKVTLAPCGSGEVTGGVGSLSSVGVPMIALGASVSSSGELTCINDGCCLSKGATTKLVGLVARKSIGINVIDNSSSIVYRDRHVSKFGSYVDGGCPGVGVLSAVCGGSSSVGDFSVASSLVGGGGVGTLFFTTNNICNNYHTMVSSGGSSSVSVVTFSGIPAAGSVLSGGVMGTAVYRSPRMRNCGPLSVLFSCLSAKGLPDGSLGCISTSVHVGSGVGFWFVGEKGSWRCTGVVV